MRRHAAHSPHASHPVRADSTGAAQFTSCARATAAMCLPTPEGPAKIRLGGSVPRERRARNQAEDVLVTDDVAKWHQRSNRITYPPPGFFFSSFFLSSFFVAIPKTRRPEPTLLFGSSGRTSSARRGGWRRAVDWLAPAQARAARTSPSARVRPRPHERFHAAGALAYVSAYRAGMERTDLRRLRPFPEVLGVESRPRLDPSVRADNLHAGAAVARQLSGYAADRHPDDIRRDVRTTQIRGPSSPPS